ncbi:RrF2 family transcriptional regulator [Donghicola eburneus]|uniref:Rrf2 family transcriptional regulator n=1 Tax=Donghicola eburneus TaxID=393278 RepID=A0A1M4N4Q3_9RHOB|nr:Rrf2 family transcriptional regulator [Donghicola eburneus]SCM68036.1 Rrf2 family transcriptional regulator [Donghicola eburneus]SFQ52951.1 transcriptional regulator, BadM/Rrf2 family [Donghicola eburneus]
MRITKRTNIAIRALMFCAVNMDRRVTKHDIAEACNSSENHLGQIVNQLAQLGFLETTRGRGGGLTLARAPGQISIGEVFRLLEADVPVAECFADVDNTCPLTDACRLKEAIAAALDAFYSHMETITLDTLICDNHALETMLAMTPLCSGDSAKKVQPA